MSMGLLVMAALAQSPRVVVYDVSAPDAVYEDIARDAAKVVAGALASRGMTALRAEVESMREPRCRVGPCLAKVAARHEATVLVTLDVAEAPNEMLSIACAALRATNGALLSARRWIVRAPTEKHQRLDELAKELAAALAPPDAGADTAVK